MNWEALGAIGEVFGAIAVFITLGYLAIQVRHARQETRRALRQGRSEALRQLFAWSGEEGMARIRAKMDAAFGLEPHPFVAAIIDRAGLTHQEAMRALSLSNAFWDYRAQIIPAVDELSEIERHGFDRAIAGSYGQGSWASLFYETLKPIAHPDMVQYIEDVLARVELRDPTVPRGA
jgi:hypothetical protein